MVPEREDNLVQMIQVSVALQPLSFPDRMEQALPARPDMLIDALDQLVSHVRPFGDLLDNLAVKDVPMQPLAHSPSYVVALAASFAREQNARAVLNFVNLWLGSDPPKPLQIAFDLNQAKLLIDHLAGIRHTRVLQ